MRNRLRDFAAAIDPPTGYGSLDPMDRAELGRVLRALADIADRVQQTIAVDDEANGRAADELLIQAFGSDERPGDE